MLPVCVFVYILYLGVADTSRTNDFCVRFFSSASCPCRRLLCLSSSLHHLRTAGPQKPPSSVADDIVRSNHYDPDEDEDYYRKQLSYFDKLQAGPNKPQPQAQAAHNFR